MGVQQFQEFIQHENRGGGEGFGRNGGITHWPGIRLDTVKIVNNILAEAGTSTCPPGVFLVYPPEFFIVRRLMVGQLVVPAFLLTYFCGQSFLGSKMTKKEAINLGAFPSPPRIKRDDTEPMPFMAEVPKVKPAKRGMGFDPPPRVPKHLSGNQQKFSRTRKW